MTLDDARNNIGRSVVYKPFKGCDKSQYEYGVITRVGDVFVFVRYGSEILSKATNPKDLRFMI